MAYIISERAAGLWLWARRGRRRRTLRLCRRCKPPLSVAHSTCVTCSFFNALCVERKKHDEEIIRECNLCCCVTSQLVHILGLADHRNIKIKKDRWFGVSAVFWIAARISTLPGGRRHIFLGRMGSRCGGLGSVSLGDIFFL